MFSDDLFYQKTNISIIDLSFNLIEAIKPVILSFIRLIPQVTVDNNLGPDRFAGLKSRPLLLKSTNPLIARPLSGSPNCA